MKVRAAVAHEASKPLEIEEVDLDGPKQGECLVRLAATGVCHTDAYTLSGKIPKACSRRFSATRAQAWSRRSARACSRWSPGTT